MNVRMWIHPATKKKLQDLIGYGYKFIGPENGEMACGEYGKMGKMSSPRQIFAAIKNYFRDKNKLCEKKTVLITAGPTRRIY